MRKAVQDTISVVFLFAALLGVFASVGACEHGHIDIIQALLQSAVCFVICFIILFLNGAIEEAYGA